MNEDMITDTAIEKIQSDPVYDISTVLIESEARAKLMKNILPHLVQVCHDNNILEMRDNNGGTKPYINNDGCQKIARIAGISFSRPEVTVSLENMPAIPATYWEDSGKQKTPSKPARQAYIVEIQGEASLMGQTITEFGGASSEDGFYNRPKESPVEIRLEVRKKAMANWQGRCVRTLLGLQGLSWEDLERVGFNRGKGGGVDYNQGKYSNQKDTSGDQQAIDETKAKIRDQILTDVAGNKETAGDLLEMVTSFTSNNNGKVVPGIRIVDRLSDARANTTWGKIKPGGKGREEYNQAVMKVSDKYGLFDKPKKSESDDNIPDFMLGDNL